MQSAKEKASNAAASARAGMEKTKAAVQEKVDKMKTRDPQEKAMAEQRREERQHEAELDKQITKEDNAEGMAARRMGEHHHSTAGLGSGNTVTRTPVAGERVIGGPATA